METTPNPMQRNEHSTQTTPSMQQAQEGFLAIDKPGGMTSRDVVNRVQRWFPRRTKIGHAGTLDPLATGLLVLGIGRATKLIERVQAMPKTYRTRIRLGATSDTDDADGEVAIHETVTVPTLQEVESLLPEFIGTLQQVPPAYSALKVDGVRSYARARRGEEVTLAARPVQVYGVTLVAYEWPWLDLEIHCGKGTYIRSIARDVGERLGTGGMVQELRRTRIGMFTASQAIALDSPPEAGRAALVPPGILDTEMSPDQ